MTQRAPEASEWVALGVLGKPRGLRGDLWFRSYNEASEALAAGVVARVVLRDGSKRSITVEDISEQSGDLLMRFVGVDSRTAAEALTGASLELQRKDFPPLEEGEFYHCDLPGMRVVDEHDAEVGTVTRVEAYPTVDALVIATKDGEVEVPITDDVVHRLDVAARIIVVGRAALEG